jgi:putative transposase
MECLSRGEKRRLVTHINGEHRVSIRQGCRAVGLARSTYRYTPKPKRDKAVIDALNALIGKHPAIGFWQAYRRLRLAGRPWNHKRVYRIYTALCLNIRRHAKNRLPARVKQRLFQPTKRNQVWSLDYIHDSLEPMRHRRNGRTFRMLNVLDDYNRQVLRIESDTCLPAQRVIRVLEQLEESRGLPSMIRVDNGPEFISQRLDTWCKDCKITLAFGDDTLPTHRVNRPRTHTSSA